MKPMRPGILCSVAITLLSNCSSVIFAGLILGGSPSSPIFLSPGDSFEYSVNVISTTAPSNLPQDAMAAWQIVLMIQPEESATGAVVFENAMVSEPPDYVFSATSNLGISANVQANTLTAFDINFPFSGGVQIPNDRMLNLIDFELRSTGDASGRFDIIALGGPAQTEWTNAAIPIQLVRQFDNIPESGLIIAQVQVRDTDLLGDFNNDGEINVTDIDLLAQSMRGSPIGNTEFDLNGSGRVDIGDLRQMVEQILGTYFGDANVDLEFNSNDLISVFQAGGYEDDIIGNSTWGSGDWDGDGDFKTGDLILAFQSGSYELGPRTASKIVPEPNHVLVCLVFLIIACRSQ